MSGVPGRSPSKPLILCLIKPPLLCMSLLYRLLVTSLVLSVSVTCVFAAAPALEHTQLFALGGIYEDGRMSDGERALRAILRKSDATAQLEAMLLRASPAGRLYALLGLRLRDRAVYARVLRTLPEEDAQVAVMRGGVIRVESFRALVSEIQHGKYDSSALSHPAW
jgi:hypothetical protein